MKAKRLVTILVIALFSLSIAACAGKRKKKAKKQDDKTTTGQQTTKGPSPLTAEEKKIQTAAMALMEKVGAAAVEHKDDCDALAAAWQTLWDENADLVKQAIKIDSDPMKVAEWEAGHAKQRKAIDAKLEPAFEKCSKHKGINDLLARMQPKAKDKKKKE